MAVRLSALNPAHALPPKEDYYYYYYYYFLLKAE
jgi:hypothetical protein